MILLVFLLCLTVPVQLNEFCYVQKYNITNPTSNALKDEEFFFEFNFAKLVEQGKIKGEKCPDFRMRVVNNDKTAKWLDFWLENNCQLIDTKKTEDYIYDNSTKVWTRMNFTKYESKVLEVYYFNRYADKIPLSFGTPLRDTGDTRFENRTYKGEFYQMYPTKANPSLSAEFAKIGYEIILKTGSSETTGDKTHTLSPAFGNVRYLMKGNNMGGTGVGISSTGNFQSHTHTIPQGITKEPGAEYGFSGVYERVTEYFAAFHKLAHIHPYSNFDLGLATTSTGDFTKDNTYIPESLELSLFKGDGFGKIGGVVFFTEDDTTDFTSKGAVEFTDCHDRFLTLRDGNDMTTQITTRGANFHDHSSPGGMLSGQTGNDIIDSVVSGSTKQSWVGHVNDVIISERTSFLASFPNHTHGISCTCSKGSTVPDFVRVKMLRLTNKYAAIDPKWIFMANSVPPMGFVEYKKIPTAFMRGSSVFNVSYINKTEGHSHFINCTTKAETRELSPGMYPYNNPISPFTDKLYFNTKTGKPALAGTYPMLKHTHKNLPAIVSKFTNLPTSNSYPYMTFRYLQRKTNKVLVSTLGGETKIGTEALCRRVDPIIPPTTEEPSDNNNDLLLGLGIGFGVGIPICGVLCGCIFLICCACLVCCVFVLFNVLVILILVFVVVVVLLCGGCCCIMVVGVLVFSFTRKKKVVVDESEEMQEMLDKEKESISERKRRLREEKEKKREEVERKKRELEERERDLDQEDDQDVSMSMRSMSMIPSKSNLNTIPFDFITVGEEIGKGYLGNTIHKGQWEEKDVMVKLFDSKLLKTKKFNVFEFFERDLAEYSLYDHPNVLLYEGYSKLPKVAVVTEYCENGDLKSYMKENTLEFSQVVKIVTEIVDAMEFLHNRGVIHRDIQACNIYLMDDLCPKVDFGFNQTFKKEYTTSQYAAPELIEEQSIPDDDDELPQHEKFDVKCDVFSFGILMFEIATNNFNPYDVDSEKEEVAIKVAEDGEYRPDFESSGLDIPNWYINLATMCWAHKATERPSFERIKGILKNVSSMEDGSDDDDSSSETESEESD